MSEDKFPKRIMLATDGSKHSLHAAKKAAQLAKGNDSEVLIVNVLQPYKHLTTSPGPMDIGGQLDIEKGEDVLSRGKKVMESTRKIFDDHSVEVKTNFLKGNPSRAIINEAIKEKIDLIVVGATGYSGISEWLLGSTAHKIARNAHCPVMIVR